MLNGIPLLEEYGHVGRQRSDGVDPNLINIVTSQGVPIDSYQDCYETVRQNYNSDNAMYDEFFNNGGFTFLEKLEEKFDCAGICYSPLFYLTKDTSNSPVAQECVGAFLDSVKATEGAGAVAIITGITLFAASLGAIPLCSDFVLTLGRSLKDD